MSVIDQKEYLKKYLSIGKDSKKKKKRKIKKEHGLKIIDYDDETLTSSIKEDLLADNEDAPQIVAVIDERPISQQVDDKDSSKLWIPIGGDNSVKIEAESLNFKMKPIKIKKEKAESPERVTVKIERESPVRDLDSYRNSDNLMEFSDLRVKGERDISPVRRGDGDMSPVRRRGRDSDISPVRRKDRDMSLKRRKDRDNDDISPKRRRNEDGDMSPVRKRNRDLSPKRKRDKDNDISPVRRKDRDMPTKSREQRDRSPIQEDRDLSPSRRKRNISPSRKESRNMSPPRIHSNKKTREENRKDRKKDRESTSKNEEASESGTESKHSREHSTDNKEATENSEVTRISLREMVKRQKKEKPKIDEETKRKYSRWGAGLKQVEDMETRISEELHEMNKPLARYADDEDLDKYLREQEREGDPMLAYLRKKKKKQDVAEGKPSKPIYQGGFMPNRFGIRPGHRWDGVDRSNGYEKRWFEVQNSKMAQIEESYKWSTEDM